MIAQPASPLVMFYGEDDQEGEKTPVASSECPSYYFFSQGEIFS
jgi:hypothetical protein